MEGAEALEFGDGALIGVERGRGLGRAGEALGLYGDHKKLYAQAF